MYADYKDQSNQTLVHILGSFLHQFLTNALAPVPDEIIQKLQDIRHQGRKLGIEDTLALLKTRLHQLNRVFICIDAVDELEPKVREQLLKVLQELVTSNHNINTRLFLTGRGHVESEVQKHFKLRPGNIVHISASQHDIREFLSQQIKEDRNRNPELMDEVLAKDITDVIIKKSQGMYVMGFGSQIVEAMY